MSRIESYAQGTPSFVDLTTPDQDAAKTFYADLFGWEYDDQPLDEGGYLTMQMNGGDYTCLVAGGRPVGAALPPSIPGQPPYWNVYFNVESTDATIARVVELGGRVVAAPWDVPDVGRLAAVSDPQGAMFCAMQNAGD